VKVLITIFMLVSFTVGCTSFKTTSGQPTEVAVSKLSIGDTVQIVTVDGTKVRLTIEVIEDDTIIGDNFRIPIEDIRIISVERIDAGKTTAASIIIFGVAACVGLLVLVSSL